MADIHRQLQEYLAKGKAGWLLDAEPLIAALLIVEEEAEEPEAAKGPAGAWLGRTYMRWTWSRSSAKLEAEPEPAWPLRVTRMQQLAASGLCLLLATLCFGLAALYAHVLLLRARKFTLLWSLGSALALVGKILRGGTACRPLLRGEEAPSWAALLYLFLYFYITNTKVHSVLAIDIVFYSFSSHDSKRKTK
ncbi:vesicle transport protein SFT2C-like [Saccopteryx bilineata]|uniref:vesicle transport protein SFT2C-like n=1 Tax=Saccopteryx bilineata TaxID=59482 RepID=UPI00338E9670